jgi:hypothetical protein
MMARVTPKNKVYLKSGGMLSSHADQRQKGGPPRLQFEQRCRGILLNSFLPLY